VSRVPACRPRWGQRSGEGIVRFRCLLTVAAASAVVSTAALPAAARVTQSVPEPGLVVTPADNLVDGQAVQVVGTRFPPGESVLLLQCRAGIGSMDELATVREARTLETVDASGSFSVFQTRRQRDRTGPRIERSVDCQAAAAACASLPRTTGGPRGFRHPSRSFRRRRLDVSRDRVPPVGRSTSRAPSCASTARWTRRQRAI
jgi:hypothetical protein